MAIDTTLVRLDFEVLKTNSCKSLKILDLSNWANAEADPAYIQITTPGQTKPVTHIFRKEKRNVFNSNNLNLSDVIDYSDLAPLPDGMYTITLLQCEDDPLAVTKYHFQDCIIRCQVARKLLAVDLSCNSCRTDLIKEIQDISLFLDAAQANADKCNVNKAMELYRRAQKALDRISDTDSSNCGDC